MGVTRAQIYRRLAYQTPCQYEDSKWDICSVLSKGGIKKKEEEKKDLEEKLKELQDK